MKLSTDRAMRGGAVGLAAALVAGAGMLASSAAQAAPAEHVTICHARGTPDTAGNGYVVISPSKTGVIKGHANWDFKDHEVGDNGHAADIVPPFDYEDNKGVSRSFPGQNWDAVGQATWNQDCSGDGSSMVVTR